MTTTLEKAGYIDAATLTDGGGGYDWQEMHVYTFDGRVFVNGQAGCSCNSWETPGVGDLIEVATLDQAQRAWSEAITIGDQTVRWLNEVRSVFAGLGLR